MNSPPDRDPDRQLHFLLEFLDENASIDGDVLEISSHTWAIHGEVPVDGEILMAEFETYDEARSMLDQVRRSTGPSSDT
jgi:hypothetical protein